ncbi:hypothetical protein RhiirA4_542142 [Rhizophagus irregularis]|uniref:Uncharacterized protein n=1 Tax=Rhizophagus irregularis TaxID=588596 RepID=A0A2I1GE10_9GLOM|nr:hypothetical protein RhiirA4_542142 [Rhizophagus irregularis]
MSSYNYLRNRSHSSGQQPQGQPPLLPPTSTRSSSITQYTTLYTTIPFSYHSQPLSSSDYSSSLSHSVPIQHQPIPPCSTCLDKDIFNFQNFHTSRTIILTIFQLGPPVMSIPQLLSGDPSEDLDYSYSKSQNGSGAYDEYSRRSAVVQTKTSALATKTDELGLGND